MSKEELKLQYKLKKISTKEYFSALSELMKRGVPETKPDYLNVFDGKLPLVQ